MANRLIMGKKIKLAFLLIMMVFFFGCAQAQTSSIKPGAERTSQYLAQLKGKRVAVVANPASRVNRQHLVDTLIALGVDLKKIFSPEHGFRGTADAGEKVTSGVDPQSGLSVVSLYGKHKKPYPEDLQNIDLVLFDLQDVGVRFYTYISTLHYVMEACAENHVSLIVLDRPNPNAFYVDGPVLKPGFNSFVGMHPVPVVYGMSIGEYAQMINGEGWLNNGIRCDLKVIACSNWEHRKEYVLPVKPSPNLPNRNSIILYPSLCFFEGTVVSAGRGTDFPFQCYGHPNLADAPFSFVPRSIPGASKNPKFKGRKCFGFDLREGEADRIRKNQRLNLSYLLRAYRSIADKEQFFNNFFEKLAGTDELRQQIEKGMSEEQIRATWQKDLNEFKKTREKYLIYH